MDWVDYLIIVLCFAQLALYFYSRARERRWEAAHKKIKDSLFAEVATHIQQLRGSEILNFHRWLAHQHYEHLVGEQYIDKEDFHHLSLTDIVIKYLDETTHVTYKR